VEVLDTPVAIIAAKTRQDSPIETTRNGKGRPLCRDLLRRAALRAKKKAAVATPAATLAVGRMNLVSFRRQSW
jgi:hypothetical protein